MLDISVAYNKYQYLGNEFLTWLWFVMETDPALLTDADPELGDLHIGNRVVLERTLNDDAIETITIKGDDAGLEEGMMALGKGAMVTEMNLVYSSGDHEWRFSIKGESLNFSSVKAPPTEALENKSDVEGAILEKVYLYERVFTFVDALYARFLDLRVKDDWGRDIVPRMRAWITAAATAQVQAGD
ncbi:MAG: hypothetical protein CSA22_05260 [Deltaproteobacteria bacterium]|nr:MAG: hypothetical protein CSA22_05260 [Deltaproteobacteria bacterium]